MLEASFVTSKQQLPAEGKKKSVILWVKDYDITPEEKEKGYLGNFIAISYKQADKKWTLYPTKILMDLKHHPLRAYKNDQKHPNWGHPILRAIKKKTPYKTLDAANKALMQLHEQYPTASIPTKSKFYLMIFSREANPAMPVQKYVFEIKTNSDGSYGIDVRLNDYKAKKKSKQPKKKQKINKDVTKSNVTVTTQPNPVPSVPKTSETEAAGKFTARESLRRQKKGRK